MILAIFVQHVTMMLPTKFQINWPFGSEEAKDFQDGHHSSHLGFLIRMILVNWPFGSGEEAKDFQDLGFPIRMILTIFDLQVTLMLLTLSFNQLAFQSRRSEK